MKFLLIIATVALIPQMSWAKNYTLRVTENGFEPETIQVTKGKDVTLKVTRTTDETCAKQIVIPAKKIRANLPLNKLVTLHLGKLEKGELNFACGVGMMKGKLVAQ